jgi:hypothetical protein
MSDDPKDRELGRIETSASLASYFRETVEGACKNQKVDATPAAQSYLSGLLEDFVRPGQLGETLDRSLTLMLDEALQTPPPERFEKLRALGDGTLYVSGFFGDHLEARGVDDALVASIGGFAYRSVASMLRGGSTVVDVYAELSQKFLVFVSVLAEVAESTSMGVKTSTGALRLYEKWLRTGNDRIARELASHGLVPVKPGSA